MSKVDKYISPGGRLPDYNRDKHIKDLMCVSAFLLWQDPTSVMGGYTAREATDAFFRIVDMEQAKFRKIMGSSET